MTNQKVVGHTDKIQFEKLLLGHEVTKCVRRHVREGISFGESISMLRQNGVGFPYRIKKGQKLHITCGNYTRSSNVARTR